jgi:hypothetical protein
VTLSRDRFAVLNSGPISDMGVLDVASMLFGSRSEEFQQLLQWARATAKGESISELCRTWGLAGLELRPAHRGGGTEDCELPQQAAGSRDRSTTPYGPNAEAVRALTAQSASLLDAKAPADG